MIHKLKNILTGLKNLWKWRKVIYKDRDWDSWYIFEILKTKLKFQAEHFIKYGYHESSSVEAKRMLECVDLIDKVQNEYYIEEGIKGLSDLEWSDAMFKEATEKHDEAKKRLFEMIEDNIERWWN